MDNYLLALLICAALNFHSFSITEGMLHVVIRLNGVILDCDVR